MKIKLFSGMTVEDLEGKVNSWSKKGIEILSAQLVPAPHEDLVLKQTRSDLILLITYKTLN